MATSPSTPDIPSLLALISPVLAGLFGPSEIEHMALTRRRGGTEDFLLAVTVRDEVSQHHVWSDGQAEESPEEFQSRLAGELQDFIAESRFAWGTWRPWPPDGAAP